MSKKLIALIRELTKLKIAYYRKLGLNEINIDKIIEDVFEDIYTYFEDEFGFILDTITVSDALVLMLKGVE